MDGWIGSVMTLALGFLDWPHSSQILDLILIMRLDNFHDI